MTGKSSRPQCVFCRSEGIKKRILFQNKFAWAFLTNIPVVPGHTLIAPTRCVATFGELTGAEVKAIFDIRKRFVPVFEKVFQAEGFNYAWNEHEVAGQTVPHFHLHMLPRKKGDTGITDYEPRKFLYRSGSREPSPEQELQAVSRLMRSALNKH